MELERPNVRNNNRHNNNHQKNDDSTNQTHAHLHVLPPHLLPDSVCTAAETLGRVGKVVYITRVNSLLHSIKLMFWGVFPREEKI